MQVLNTNKQEIGLLHGNPSQTSIILIIAALICIIATSVYAGYFFAQQGAANNNANTEQTQQKQLISRTKIEVQEHINALAMRLGVLQAKMTRIEATSSRLRSLAGLEGDEFDFDQLPAIGGVMDPDQQLELSMSDFIKSLKELSGKLENSQQDLSMLDSKMLMDKIETDAKPSGKPVAKGWLSSGFGKRTDPISGKHDFHRGVDFAGKKGTKIFSVAKGVVTWSGQQKGYGNVVEIDHGQGYVTRYAHNEKNLVKVGDQVEKGQAIGLMGSTGRVTGTHVHFEVEKAGKLIDPAPYLKKQG